MAESYEKRARAKRKQLERRRKLERKRTKEPDEEEKVEVSGDEYLMTPEDYAAMKEEGREEEDA